MDHFAGNAATSYKLTFKIIGRFCDYYYYSHFADKGNEAKRHQTTQPRWERGLLGLHIQIYLRLSPDGLAMGPEGWAGQKVRKPDQD